MRWKILFLGWLCLVPLWSYHSFEVLDNHPFVRISKPLHYTTGELSVSEAYERFKDNHFTRMPKDAYSFGFSDKPFWFAIEVENGCMESLFLSLRNLSLEHVEYFVFQEDTLVKQGKTGAFTPIKEREFASLDPRVPLLGTPHPTTYLVKIRSNSPLLTPFLIGTDGALQLFFLPEVICIALFSGIFIALFLYNGILYFVTKEKDYLLYSIYIFFMFVLMLSIREYFSPLFQDKLYMQNIIKFISLEGSVLFLILFTLSFLNIKELNPKLHHNTLYLTGAALALFFLIPLGALGQHIGIVAIVTIICWCLFLGIYAHMHHTRVAQYYLIASGGLFISVFIFLATAQGMLPYTLATFSSTILGAEWEMILFSLALGYKIKLLFHEHTKAITQIQAQHKILFLQSRYTSVGELIRNITHQWKEPLGEIGSIQTNLKTTLLLQGSVSKEKIINAVNLSHTIIRHLAETIDTFYRFFRQTKGENQRFDITQEVAGIQKMIKYSFDTEHITLHYTYTEPIFLVGHHNEFAHAILNVILNAKDILMRRKIENPFVRVYITRSKNHAHITIEDNAGGITQEPLDKIFDIGVSSSQEHIGIGLYIAKTIIEQKMHGFISVSNTEKGALFSITLPLSAHTQRVRTQTLPLMEESVLERITTLEKDVARRVEIEKNLQQWAHIFEHAHWGIAICGVKTNTLDLINPEFARMHGFSVEELLHQPLSYVVATEEQTKLSDILQKVYQEGHYTFESNHLRKDGSSFPVDIDLICVASEKNDLLYYIVNVRDITLYKQTHERLLLKRFALNHIQDAVFLTDADANFCDVNDAACHTLGYTHDELMQMNVGDIDPDWPREKWPEHWEALKHVGSMTMVLRHKRKDGSIFPVEVSANYIEFNGKAYNMGVARDISERKAAEKELLLINNALNTTNEAAYIMVNERFVHVNEGACQMLGYTREEFASMNLYDIDPEVEHHEIDLLIQDMRTLGTMRFERKHRTKEGLIIDVEIVASFFDYEGVEYSLAVARDIRERRLLEAQKDNERMRLFFEKQLVGMAISSPEKSWINVNDKLCAMLGYSREELTNQTWQDLTYPEDLEPDVKEFERVLKGEIEGFSIQKRFIHKNGTLVYTNLMTTCVRKKDGNADYFLTLIEDITEQTKSRKTIDLLYYSLNFSTESIYWIDVETFRFIQVNDTAIKTLGYSQEEFIGGMAVCDIDPDYDASVLQHHVEELKQCKIMTFETYHKAKSGVIFPVEVRSSYFEYDNRQYILSLVTDITERKRMEEQLKENQANLLAIISTIPDKIWLKDKNGIYLMCNSAYEKFLGVSKDEIIGKTDYDFVTQEQGDFFRQKDAEAMAAGTICINEEEVFQNNGQYAFLETRKVPVYNEQTLIGILGIGRDITELTKKKNELEKSLELNESIIHAIPDLLFEITEDGTYVGIWAQNEALLIEQKKHLLGKNLKEILPQEAIDVSLCTMKEVDEKGFSIGNTYSLDFPDGKKWFELSVSKRKSSNTYMTLSRDITKRKHAQEALIHLTQTLEARIKERTQELQNALSFSEGIINALPDLLFELDLEGNYLNVWAHDEQLLAAQKELLLGKSLYDVLSLEAADTVMKALQEANTKGVSFGNIIQIELPQGVMYFEESVSKKASSNTFLVLSHDITNRKHFEISLAQSEEAFRAIVENSPDVVARYDLQYRRIYVNPKMQELLNKPLDEVIGQKPSQHTPLPSTIDFEQLLDRVIREKEEIRFVTPYLMPNGEESWGDIRIIPEFNAQKEVMSILMIGKDLDTYAPPPHQIKSNNL